MRKQQERLNRYDGDRIRFKELLQNALSKGAELRESKPSESEARGWAEGVRAFIEAANETVAHRFMRVDPGGVSNDIDATPAQAYLDKRISRLTELIQKIASQDSVPFRSGFDPYDYDPATLLPKVSKDVFQDEFIEIAHLARQLGHFKTPWVLGG